MADELKECKSECDYCNEVACISLKRMYLILLKTQEMILENKRNKREIVSFLSSIEHDILLLNDKENHIDRDLWK